jgi:hypothetical protein
MVITEQTGAGMEIGQADQVVSAFDWRDEVEVLSPTRIRVAAVDRLGGVTPGMLDWWFSRMDEETCFRFHPVDHKAFAWVRGKEPGRHVGGPHLTHHCYGGRPPLLPSEVSFVPPGDLLDTTAFAAHGVGTAICAVVHGLDPGDRPYPQEAGRLRHVHEEFAYLTGLLPGLWAAEHGAAEHGAAEQHGGG